MPCRYGSKKSTRKQKNKKNQLNQLFIKIGMKSALQQRQKAICENGRPMLGKLYGIHENALSLKARRMEVLSNNIANADTPGFKARDVDFHKVLSWQLGAGGLETTHTGHLASPHALDNGQVFTIPYNTSVDGNTVEMGLEQAKFGKAAMEYQATLDFLQGRVTGYKRALKGE